MSAEEIAHPYHASGPVTLLEAQQYCKRLATSHYENFLVAGVFCPKPLRQHFYNIYTYCRISDDLSDEIGDTRKSLILLDWWQDELEAMYRGAPRHPAFVALHETVAQFGIPASPFRNLLTAFRQDQVKTRYQTFEEVLDYCVNSANPVGQLVLYLCGYNDVERFKLSDNTCTALQLANFWQDVTRDLEKDRIYIPREDMDRFGYNEELLFQRKFTPEFAALMRAEVQRTHQLFASGSALGALVDTRVRLDIEMFTLGGTEVLRLIEKQNYDVLTSRPSVSKKRQMTLLFRRLVSGWFAKK